MCQNIYNPTVNIGANYNKTDLDIHSNGVGATSTGYTKFSIKLYNGGKNSSIKRQKSFELKSAKFENDTTTKEILLQAVMLFYQIKTTE